jgi:MFS family permease
MFRNNRRILVYVFLFSAASINYIDRVALSVAAKPIAVAYKLSPVEMGYLFSAFLWTYALAAVPWGLAVDRLGSKVTSAIGMLWWSASTVATALFGCGFASILGTRLAMGLGESSTYPAAERVLREWIPGHQRGLATVIFNSGGYLGPAIGSLTMGAIASHYGWRVGFVLIGCLGFIWMALWLFWFSKPETSRFITDDERKYILTHRGPETKAHGKTPFAAMLRSKSIWGIAITQGGIIYTLYMLLTWMPSYLQETRHLSLLHTGLYSAVPYAVAAPCSFVAGYCSDFLLRNRDVRRGERRYLIAFLLVCSAIIYFVRYADSLGGVLGLFIISLCCISSAAGLNLALLGDLVRDHEDVGKATGIQLSVATVIGLLSPIITGYIVKDTNSYNAAFALDAAVMIAAAVSCMTLCHLSIPEISTPVSVPAYHAQSSE